MMDTRKIYEEVMLKQYFNRMKYIRNSWNIEWNDEYRGVESLIDVEGTVSRQYTSTMDSCQDIIFEMLIQVVVNLIEAYKIPVQYYDLRRNETTLYYVGEQKNWSDYFTFNSNEKQVLAFSRKDKHQEVLYVFKKYGVSNSIPETVLDKLLKAAKLKAYCYISYIEDNAFSEVINNNHNENDPTRGTNIFSFKQFMNGFFERNEYDTFKEYANLFSSKVRDYFGFAIVKTLKPNTLFNFKKTVLNDLLKTNAMEIGVANGINEEQRRIIEKHFFDEKNYEVLLGSGDFAQSYMTAEWLFSSLNEVGNIDLTVIAMGYFKAIEQVLFAFLKNHTYEREGAARYIFIGKGKPNTDIYGYTLLTDSLLKDEDRIKDLTLGSLTGFFGFHDTRSNRYKERNRELLYSEITDDTYHFIIDKLGSIVGLRNGYFHKDNLAEWDKVVEARNEAKAVFYLLLGAYSISELDKTHMGIIRVDEHDDYYKLCEYVNNRSFEPVFPEIPIIYYKPNNPDSFVYFYHDDLIEFDNYGEPIYSGVYFKIPFREADFIRCGRDDLPQEIWEGKLVISESYPIKFSHSGPMKKIFSNGKFVAYEDNT